MDTEIIGKSPELMNALEKVRAVANTAVPVLILGESGVGKELIARAIHREGRNHSGPLVRVNCAAVPRELFESEFFGHVRGAFTGAHESRTGHFEKARGGTLFLDEVSEIPVDLQSKLLRVLQEGEFEAVGDSTLRRSTARVIAACNRDLRTEVEAGRFREDLYYRLSVFPIEIPSLRKRPDDIRRLTQYFLENAGREFGRPRLELPETEFDRLFSYAWPGNIRELKNVIERAVLLSQGNEVSLRGALPETQTKRPAAPFTPEPMAATMASDIVPLLAATGGEGGVTSLPTLPQLKHIERRVIVAALTETRWRVSGPRGAAALLAVKPTTLTSRMKAMGIARPA